MTVEAVAQSEIIARSFAIGLSLYRNNSGVAREGHRHVRYGLGNDSRKINEVWKSGDLIGLGPGGRFMMVETKHSEWVYAGTKREVAQHNAICDINRQGGIAFFCRSVLEFDEMMIRMGHVW